MPALFACVDIIFGLTVWISGCMHCLPRVCFHFDQTSANTRDVFFLDIPTKQRAAPIFVLVEQAVSPDYY